MSPRVVQADSAPTAPPQRRGGGRFLFLCLVVLALYAYSRYGAAPEPVLAQVTAEGGEVTIVRADADDQSLSAGAGAEIQRGDTVRTAGDASAHLELGIGEVLLSGGSEILVLQLERNTVLRGLAASLALQSGQAEADVVSLGLGGSLTLETDVVTVRGMAFLCRVDSTEQVTVEAYGGGVTVSEGEDSVALIAGQRLVAALGQPLLVDGATVAVPIRTQRVRTVTPSVADLDSTLFPEPTGSSGEAATSVPATGTTYVVQSGDTLYSIAEAHGIDWQALYEANQDSLESPDVLQLGQELLIPAP